MTKDGNGLEQRGQTGIPRATTPARVVVLQLLPYLPISSYCLHVIQCYTMPRNTRLFPAVPFPSYRPIMPYLCPVPHSTVACHNCLFPYPSHHLGPPCNTYVCFAKPFSPKMNTEWDWEVTLIAVTCTCCPSGSNQVIFRFETTKMEPHASSSVVPTILVSVKL